MNKRMHPTEPDLFDNEQNAAATQQAPLAARMRPRTLEEFAGQTALLGPGSILRTAIEHDRLSSLLFWGPPGCGKSTLARLIAAFTSAFFEEYSAVTSGVADVRRVIDAARMRGRQNRKTILFIDEIHRWNRTQQDALLPWVEDGTVILIGATTENPAFEVNGPLLSRLRLYRFESLSRQDIEQLVNNALRDAERGLGSLRMEIDAEALQLLTALAEGDARRALTILEAAALSLMPAQDGRRVLTVQKIEESAQQRAPRYDKKADQHYNIISAFIKSVRGSDADASLYWLAVMLEAGEDPRFIMRRLLILASEDVGNADPMALVLASAAAQALQFAGMPEAQLTLAQCTIYLAAAPKSNAAATAIARARAAVQNQGVLPVPLHLCDKRSVAAKASTGPGYLYPHDYPGHHVEQQYLPENVEGTPFYEPSEEGREAAIKQRMLQRQTKKNA